MKNSTFFPYSRRMAYRYPLGFSFRAAGKRVLLLMCALFAFMFALSPTKAEAKAASLSNKRLEVTVGKSKRLKLQNNKKKVNWSILSGKSCIQIKGKSKSGVTIVGKKAGKAAVRAKIGKKKYICNVMVKNAKKNHTTPILLTIGNKKLKGYLYDTEPAKSLIAKLPITIILDDSDNDFCGGNLNIKYSEKDVQNGYKNGDLAFWTPGKNFVIFVDDEEKSADTGDLVILGKLTESQKVLDSLKGTLKVTITLGRN